MSVATRAMAMLPRRIPALLPSVRLGGRQSGENSRVSFKAKYADLVFVYICECSLRNLPMFCLSYQFV